MSKVTKSKLPPPKLVLVIDPAAAAGVALFAEGKLVAHSPAKGDSFRSLMQVVSPLVEPYLAKYPESERICLLEQHWMSFRSVKGSLTLGQRRGIAQSAGEACGFNLWLYIGASTWQNGLFGGRVPDTKAAAVKYVQDKYGFTPATDDVADAIAIGNYYLTNLVTW